MSLSHRIAPMTGRDPHEANRASTPLELLFDLTFVVAFSQISGEAAHYLELGDVGHGARRIRLRDVRGVVGVDQLLLARLGVRQRRPVLPRRDARGHARRPRRGARCSGCVPFPRGGRAHQQHRRGRGLRGHARRDRRAVAARGPRRPCAPQDRARVRREHLDRPGLLGRADLHRPPGGRDVRPCGAPHPHRARRPAVRRAEVRPHTVARSPHRRALRPADDHHAGRGRARDDPGDLGRRAARGVELRGRPHRTRGHRARLRTVVGVLHDAVGPDPPPLPRSRVRLGLRAHRAVRLPRRASARVCMSPLR